MRLLQIIPPVDEGTLTDTLSSKAPLLPAAARDSIEAAFAGSFRPEVDVAVGTCSVELRRMVDRGCADLLFVGPGHTARRRWLLRQLDRLPCPAICIDAEAGGFSRWTFEEARRPLQASAAMTSAHELVG
jgi:hypothetical protein